MLITKEGAGRALASPRIFSIDAITIAAPPVGAPRLDGAPVKPRAFARGVAVIVVAVARADVDPYAAAPVAMAVVASTSIAAAPVAVAIAVN